MLTYTVAVARAPEPRHAPRPANAGTVGTRESERTRVENIGIKHAPKTRGRVENANFEPVILALSSRHFHMFRSHRNLTSVQSRAADAGRHLPTSLLQLCALASETLRGGPQSRLLNPSFWRGRHSRRSQASCVCTVTHERHMHTKPSLRSARSRTQNRDAR